MPKVASKLETNIKLAVFTYLPDKLTNQLSCPSEYLTNQNSDAIRKLRGVSIICWTADSCCRGIRRRHLQAENRYLSATGPHLMELSCVFDSPGVPHFVVFRLLSYLQTRARCLPREMPVTSQERQAAVVTTSDCDKSFPHQRTYRRIVHFFNSPVHEIKACY
ncbi:hypothetical protein J6590_055038 [Homalodisca vitripennis]|nr:hypothetical protein J6590_055038 [Homalodisca vitripennis]